MADKRNIYKGNHYIQDKIDHCFSQGGGIATLENGVYECSSIELKSNVTLYVPKGTTIKYSHQVIQEEKTELPSFLNSEYDGNPKEKFIFAEKAHNISILGDGTIDGSEELFYGEVNRYHIEGKYYPRPPMIFMNGCTHISIHDVTLTKCAFWTIHLVGCRDVSIHSVRILNNLKMANCDGIDPDHCQDVRISDCLIECGDDCIVLKNTKAFQHYGPTKNVLVQNCIMTSTSAAIKLGTESESDFANIYFQNCIIKNTNRGIGIQLRDKGNINNVNFTDMFIDTRNFSEQWWGNGEPISITAFKREKNTKVGKITNIHFRNLTCHSSNGIVIAAESVGNVDNIVFDQCQFDIATKSKWQPEGIDYRPNSKTYYKNEGTPVAIQIQNVKSITFQHSMFHVNKHTKNVIDNSATYLK